MAFELIRVLLLSKERIPIVWSLVFTLIFLIFSSCQEVEDFGFLTISQTEITFNSDSTVSFSATINNPSNLEIIESGFHWGIKGHSSEGLKAMNNEVQYGNYEISVSIPLLPDKEYYVASYVETTTTTLRGEELPFVSGGLVNTGSWFNVFNSARSSSSIKVVETGFSIGEITYLIYSDGEMWSYDHSSSEFAFLQLTPISNTGKSIIYDDNAYIFSVDAFYRFDPSDLSFSKKAKFPEGERYFTSSFLIDKLIYIGLGSDGQSQFEDFWKYSIEENSWTQMTDFPGGTRIHAFSFCVNGVAYLGGGYNDCGSNCGWLTAYLEDIWKYDSELDQWAQQVDLPFVHNHLNQLQAVNINGTGYSFYRGLFYEYFESFDYWEKKAELGIINYGYVFPHMDQVFVLETRGYVDEKYFVLWRYEN